MKSLKINNQFDFKDFADLKFDPLMDDLSIIINANTQSDWVILDRVGHVLSDC